MKGKKLRARVGKRLGDELERFVELPVPVVLAILWIAGFVLILVTVVGLLAYATLLWRMVGA